MNRRSFIQTALGSALTAVSFQTTAWGQISQTIIHRSDRVNTDDIKDLLLWAPYEAFLPEQTDPVVDDPSDGTQTGVLKAEDIVKGQALTLQFWHGHGGVYHMFTITPDNFTSLKAGNAVAIYVPTTVVEDHYHMVLIDPNKPA